MENIIKNICLLMLGLLGIVLIITVIILIFAFLWSTIKDFNIRLPRIKLINYNKNDAIISFKDF